jgi:hypothetical protein
LPPIPSFFDSHPRLSATLSSVARMTVNAWAVAEPAQTCPLKYCSFRNCATEFCPSLCSWPVGTEAAAGGRSRQQPCYMACVVLDGAPLIASFQEQRGAFNDVALLPCRIVADARKLKEDAPRTSTAAASGDFNSALTLRKETICRTRHGARQFQTQWTLGRSRVRSRTH